VAAGAWSYDGEPACEGGGGGGPQETTVDCEEGGGGGDCGVLCSGGGGGSSHLRRWWKHLQHRRGKGKVGRGPSKEEKVTRTELIEGGGWQWRFT
jgi:hypothetical protein